jgi:ABC-type Zn uptake system ZnuABC Zn-binding protein ZnuA
MIHLKSALLPLFMSSMLVGSVFVASLGVQNATASANTTTTTGVTGGTTNQSRSAATTTTNNTSASNATSTEKLNVVTSVSPITNIVKNVAGDKITLTGLVPEGVNSHTFELVPSDVVKVNDADLVIIDGLGLETNVEDVVDQAHNTKPNLQILKLGDNTITPDQYIFDFSFPKEAGDPNPHLWLNVPYAMKFANLTRDKLIEMDPANADYYTQNTDQYLTKLKQLDEGIMKAVQSVPEQNRKLLTYHDSWAYFAPRYGMVVIGAVQPSDFGQPTPREVASLIDQIKTEKVPAIFGSEVFPTEVVDQIAKEANVKIVSTLSDDDLPGDAGDPQNSYVGMMLENMNNMLVPLGGNVSALSNVTPDDTYMPS